MSSFFWRATTGVNGIALRTQPTGVEVIEFTATNVLDGSHIKTNELDFICGFAENERPKKKFNQIQLFMNKYSATQCRLKRNSHYLTPTFHLLFYH